MTVLCSPVYGALRSVYLFFVLILVILCAPLHPASAEDRSGTVDTLIAAARDKRLSADRYWEVLVHYKPHGPAKKSLVDDPKFFLAIDGKTNPQAELEATLSSFISDGASGDDHPRCRFPARFAWLKEQLDIDESTLPVVTCAAYQEAMNNIKTKSAVLVFPAAHGNGPASMFGHTLIRIDSTFQSDLLSYAVNYAALARDTNGFIYTFKGLFGFYKGYYSILPYYEKVKEYNNIEHRDIWEYYLNLTEDEVRRMVMHIWEIKDTFSDYYFFTENCSYNLLFLLEAGRPSLNLTDPFRERLRFWVIPSDTVRVVMESGIVSRVKYRPSMATRIEALALETNAEDQKLALKVANQDIPAAQVIDMNITTDDKVKVLDLTAELLQYRYSRGDMEREDYLGRFLPVLRTRSSFAKASGDLSEAIGPLVSPDQGHLPGKWSVGAGRQSLARREWFTELELRPAYHDLMDPDAGYVEGAQINFFAVRGRYYGSDNSLKLQSWRFLDIFSLAPRDRFFVPVSWKVNTGFDRAVMQDGSDRLIYRVNPGGGAAYRRRGVGAAYLMLESDIQLSNVYKDRFAFGIGPSAGILSTVTDSWKVNLSARGLFYEIGERHRSVAISLAQNYKMTVNNGIQFSLSREKTFDHYQSEAKLIWNWYH